MSKTLPNKDVMMMNGVNCLAQCLAHRKHSINIRDNYQLAICTVWVHQLETELSVLF